MQHATPENTRLTSESGPRNAPEVAWEQSVGGRPPGDPVVADSLVYELGTDDPVQHTIEVATGEHTTGPAFDGLEEHLVAVGEDAYLVDPEESGTTVTSRAFDADNLRWRTDISTALSPTGTVKRDTLYLTGLIESVIVAIDVDDGTVRWTNEAVGQIGSVAATPAVVSFTAGEYVFGVDPEDGSRQWHHRIDHRCSTDAMVVDGVVTAGTVGGTVWAGSEDGDVQWHESVSEGAVEAIAYTGDHVFAGSRDGIHALDAATGEVREQTTSARDVVALSVGDARVYAVDSEARLSAHSQTNLAEQWSVTLSDFVTGGPVVLDGTVVLRTEPLADEAGGDPDATLLGLAER